ncbi:unnamed protein product [Nesidiocoris tenuis]|uniref:Uncharacterized protein n=1 Tax=Nesidiocoris tenuis TaxID=355587 RepID=A0A6H5GP80_9HEMI|nr:unnamed protein product [Nesidiocoris tenuis]
MKHLTIPRRACFNSRNFELHGFSDASESAYGACVYTKSVDEDGHTHVYLLTSKSRVAPMKTISLPRLELCAAVLLIRLMSSVLKSLRVSPSAVHYWTDSQIVLTWISGEPCQFKTFIANRVTEIQHHSEFSQWKYVNTKSNPADLVSRGVNPRELIQNLLWWNGPQWLIQDPTHWPKSQNFDLPDDDEVLEFKPINCVQTFRFPQRIVRPCVLRQRNEFYWCESRASPNRPRSSNVTNSSKLRVSKRNYLAFQPTKRAPLRWHMGSGCQVYQTPSSSSCRKRFSFVRRNGNLFVPSRSMPQFKADSSYFFRSQ